MSARGFAGAAAVAALLLAAAPAAYAADEEPTPPPVEEPTAFTLDDAQLRWGVSREANNRAFAPGTFNFFTAGTVPNLGGGGRTLTQAQWRAAVGDVRIEKANEAGEYATATWAGLTTQPNGAPLGGAAQGTSSGHQVVIDGGEGVVDPEAGTATLEWDGSFGVLFYSGMTYFSVTDPRLEVRPRSARLLGTLNGHATSMDDPDKWLPLDPREVVLADLPRAALQLPTEGGFTSTPRYAGVGHSAPNGAAQQVRNQHFGAFPASFLGYMHRVGMGSYWYSSGGSTDAYKAASPVSVSWDAGDPIDPPAPPPSRDVDNPEQPELPDAPGAPDAPAAAAPPPTGPGAPPPGAVGPAPQTSPTGSGGGAQAPASGTPGEPTSPMTGAATPPPVSREVLTPLAAVASTPDHRWHWWVGALLLLGAAGLIAPPHLPRTIRRVIPRGTR